MEFVDQFVDQFVDHSDQTPHQQMINSISLKNAGPVTNFQLKNAGQINLLVGSNSCGKTFILKTLYTAIKTIEEYKRGNELRNDSEILASKLYWTFQADKIGDLVTKGSSEQLSFESKIDNKEFSFAFGKETSKQVSNFTNKTTPRNSNSIFLPAKETLSLHHIILETRQKDKLFGFDDTYLDLALALQPTTKGRNYEEFAASRKSLESLLGGKVEIDEKTQKWFFKKGSSKFAIGATAEGIKKIAILDTLLGNRYLDPKSIIFIDEPEAALHPSAISEFLQILYKLSQTGIQIFMATHSYFVIKQMFLLAQEHQTSIPIACWNQGEWNNSDLKDEMPQNSIIDESINIYKSEVNLQLK